MKIIWSIDDGAREDLVVLASLFKKYKKQNVIFYINSHLIGDEQRYKHPRGGELLLNEELVELSSDFEIGGHTCSHPRDLKALTEEEQIREIIEDRENLQKMTGQAINSYCHPRGKYNQQILEILMIAGYTDARTVDIGFGYKNNNPLEKRAFHMYQRKEYGDIPWVKYIKQKYHEGIKNKEDEMHIWGHWFELRNNLNDFEELLKYIRD